MSKSLSVNVVRVMLVLATALWAAPGCGVDLPEAQVSQALLGSWQTQDIGSVGLAGSATSSGSDLQVSGSGADIYGTADGFRFVFQQVNGDATIIARLQSQQNTNTYAKAGVMIRETLAAGSKHAFMSITPSFDQFLYRATADQTTSAVSVASTGAPQWVKLVRAGNIFTGYTSVDGVSWTSRGSATVSMGASVYLGLAVSSHSNTALSACVFNGLSVAVGLPSPWQSQDVGSVGIAGKASYGLDGQYDLSGSGADIFGTADGFRFVYQPASGDSTIIARLLSQQNTSTYAKAGVMVRETLATGSRQASMLITPGFDQFLYRATPDQTTAAVSVASTGAPQWVKLVRAGALTEQSR